MPPQPLSWHIEARDGSVLITVSGTLDVTAGPALHRALLQCLAREPVAILVDLSGMTVTEPAATKIFPEIVHQAGIWPGTPLLLCAPEPATTTLIKNEYPSAPVFDTLADARASLTAQQAPVSELIFPIAGAARRARDLVTEACLRWDLSHLTAPATLVASELVTNAVVHARTVMTLQIRLRPRYLYLAVFDEAHTEPVLRRSGDHTDVPGGRGLQIVDVAAARWGHLRRPDGKVVWACFPTASDP